MKPLIKVLNVSKSFDNVTVLDDVSINVYEGEILTLIGPSGCGKSTLLRMMNALAIPDCGDVIFNDINLSSKNVNLNKIRSQMGMVFQSFNLFSNLSVLKNCTLAQQVVHKRKKDEAIQIAKMNLEKVGMDNFINAKVSTLSGGQKQRVAIARALCNNPKVLLFDEPTSALDPEIIHEVLDVIKKLIDEGLTMVLVTHEMKFAANISTRVAFLDDKKIIEVGTPQEIILKPKNERIIRFLKSLSF